eukprot:5667166-Amphidinium_carterae.1
MTASGFGFGPNSYWLPSSVSVSGNAVRGAGPAGGLLRLVQKQGPVIPDAFRRLRLDEISF